MKRLPSPSQDCSLGVPEFPEKSCQNNWNPHRARISFHDKRMYSPYPLCPYHAPHGGQMVACLASSGPERAVLLRLTRPH